MAARKRSIAAPPLDMLGVKGDSLGARIARDAVKPVYERWAKISEASHDRNAKLEDVKRVFRGFHQRATESLDLAHGRLASQLKELQDKIKTRTQPPITPTMAAEIRSFVRQHPDKAVDLVREDPRYATAILTGPRSLSGLSEQQFDLARQMAQSTHAPESLAELKETERAMRLIESAGAQLVELYGQKMVDWDPKESALMEELKQEA